MKTYKYSIKNRKDFTMNKYKKSLKKIFTLLLSFVICTVPLGDFSYAESDALKALSDANENLQDELDSTRKELEKMQEEEKIRRLNLVFTPNFDTVAQDSSTTISIDIKNLGESNLKFAELEISSLPSGVTLKSGDTPQKTIGDFNVGNEKTVNYELEVSKNADAGSFPVTFNFKAKYGLNNLREYTESKIFYITVEKDKNQKDGLKPVAISNISHPTTIAKGQVADFNFTITNPNTITLKPVKVTVNTEEGLVNQSQNVFVLNNLSPGESRNLSVKIFPKDDAQRKNYSINVTAEEVSSSKDTDDTSLPTSSQYSGIFYNTADTSGNVKNPYIIITNYNYGKDTVTPGEEFVLNMNFLNTSKSSTLRNIKISLSSEESIFIPLNSSNSFFIESLSPGQSYAKGINFVAKADAPTKTVSVNIDYTYEDSDGNSLTTKETISIPVVQKTVFNIDDVIQPYQVMEGEAVPISVNFYNLGKTQISNLKVTCEGSFEPDGDPTYFSGNMDAGKSDSYSVNIFPNESNFVDGKIIFSYETIDGSQQVEEKEFSFDLFPIPPAPMDDMMMEEMPVEKKSKLPFFIAGGVVVAIAGFVIYKKKQKNKESEFDLDE